MTRAACLFSDVLAVTSDALEALRLPISVPDAVTPAMAGVLVGALSGVVLFTLVLVLTGRRRSAAPPSSPDLAGAYPAVRPAGAFGSLEVVHVAPYETDARRAWLTPPVAPPPAPSSARSFDPLAAAGEIPAAPPAPRSSRPHPLGIIPADSSAMRAVSPSDLELVDDGPTEISETLFDELPSSVRRNSPPRIRLAAPSPPRHADVP